MTEENIQTVAGPVAVSKALLGDQAPLEDLLTQRLRDAYDGVRYEDPEVPEGHVLVDDDYDTRAWFVAAGSGHVIPEELWAEYEAAEAKVAEIVGRIEARPHLSPTRVAPQGET